MVVWYTLLLLSVLWERSEPPFPNREREKGSTAPKRIRERKRGMQDVSRGGRRGLHHAGGVILYRDLRSDHVSVGSDLLYSWAPICIRGQGLNIFWDTFSGTWMGASSLFFGGGCLEKQNCLNFFPVSKVLFQRKKLKTAGATAKFQRQGGTFYQICLSLIGDA